MPVARVHTSPATKAKVGPCHPSAVEARGIQRPPARLPGDAVWVQSVVPHSAPAPPPWISSHSRPSSDCLHFLPASLARRSAARLRSAPLPLFCSPAHLCFFSSSPLSSPTRLRGGDDVKLKNGISWWADGGGMVTTLSHVRISVFSSNLSPPKKRLQHDFDLFFCGETLLTMIISSVKLFTPQQWKTCFADLRSFQCLFRKKIINKKKLAHSAGVVEAPACSTRSVAQHIGSSAPAAERVFLSNWAGKLDGKEGDRRTERWGNAVNGAVASHWRCLPCFHSTGERYPLLPLSRAC